ncbi:VOC family protein [Candidatus Saccharibacteria bacterium]|nr:VOC family protein [Candidatus Saccharibacteria bacterium]MCB9821642.1 VOC family protein [Candidatus Nomurabacteria bacterium]
MIVKEFRLKLYPADYYRQRNYYLNTLGFKITHEWDRQDSKGVMFQIGGATLEFMWPVEEGLKDIATGSGLSLEVEDVDSLYLKLKDDVSIGHELRNNPWGDRSFGIIDPEGYNISFFTKHDK